MGGHTPEPWTVCKHLRSVEEDLACPCGYRGVIFGADGGGVCQPGHTITPGEEGLEPHNYPRAQQIADARRIVASVNATAGISVEALEAGCIAELVEAGTALRDDVSAGNIRSFLEVLAKVKGEGK